MGGEQLGDIRIMGELLSTKSTAMRVLDNRLASQNPWVRDDSSW